MVLVGRPEYIMSEHAFNGGLLSEPATCADGNNHFLLVGDESIPIDEELFADIEVAIADGKRTSGITLKIGTEEVALEPKRCLGGWINEWAP